MFLTNILSGTSRLWFYSGFYDE